MNIKYLNKNNFHYFFKFIFFGLINTFLSNYLLLFLISFSPLGFASFISQICHAFLGYLASKYSIFKRKGNPRSYILLVLFSWIIQWVFLKILVMVGLSPKIAILIAIPVLAFTSFTIQKIIIFR